MDGQIYDLNKKRKEQGLPLLEKPIYIINPNLHSGYILILKPFI